MHPTAQQQQDHYNKFYPHSPGAVGSPVDKMMGEGGGGMGGGHYDMDEAQSPSDRLCVSPPLSNRPQPARSPFEWMKKPSYQSQPDKSGKLFIVLFFYCHYQL